MQKKIRVGFLSSSNYLDRNVFSGSLYYMYKYLKLLDIELIPLGKPHSLSFYEIRRIIRKLNREVGKIFKIPSNEYDNIEVFLRLIHQQLKHNPCDVIYAPVCCNLVSRLDIQTPIVASSDATVCLLRDGYNLFKKQADYEAAFREEKTALEKSTVIVYSSDWAANSAINDFELDASRIKTIPFGANLDNIPEKEQIFHKLLTQQCHVLFVGKDWQRKGGNIAYQTLLDLLDLGLDVYLTMVGSEPPSEVLQHPNLKIIPFLDKNIPQQRRQLTKLFLSAHFLLFPTRYDCSPIVICEANAHGIPVISTDVGGISSIIKPGKNGYLLPLSSQSEDFACIINDIYREPEQYKKLVESSRSEYDDRLNWYHWAQKMQSIFIEVTKK